MKKVIIATLFFTLIGMLFMPRAMADDGYINSEHYTEAWTYEETLGEFALTLNFMDLTLPEHSHGFPPTNLYDLEVNIPNSIANIASNTHYVSGIRYYDETRSAHYSWNEIQDVADNYSIPMPDLGMSGTIILPWQVIRRLPWNAGFIPGDFEIIIAQAPGQVSNTVEAQDRVDDFNTEGVFLYFASLRVIFRDESGVIYDELHYPGERVSIPSPSVPSDKRLLEWFGILVIRDYHSDERLLEELQVSGDKFYIQPGWFENTDMLFQQEVDITLQAKYVDIEPYDGVIVPDNAPDALVLMLDGFGLANTFGYMVLYMFILLGVVIWLAYLRAPIWSHALVVVSVTALWAWFGFMPVWTIILMFIVSAFMLTYAINQKGDVT